MLFAALHDSAYGTELPILNVRSKTIFDCDVLPLDIAGLANPSHYTRPGPASAGIVMQANGSVPVITFVLASATSDGRIS
jgi:hypothetical protein